MHQTQYSLIGKTHLRMHKTGNMINIGEMNTSYSKAFMPVFYEYAIPNKSGPWNDFSQKFITLANAVIAFICYVTSPSKMLTVMISRKALWSWQLECHVYVEVSIKQKTRILKM